ncbi:MAG: hypothetical protein L0Y66_12230 [Myxococcaceae bacterium]|nr:hypothetical protein [Myxococcaceae bacterium]MCI0669213.1 hypothetical protein [Myxococcaceae bacterium]
MDGLWRGRLVAGLVTAAVVTAGACSRNDGVGGGVLEEPPVVAGTTGDDVLPGGPGNGEPGDEEQDDHNEAPPFDAGDPTVDTGMPQGDLTEVSAAEGGWTFYRPADGAPSDVFGVSEDEGGNLWVAGGSEGLFLLRRGATRFERFGLEQGLTPYGLWKGTVPVGEKLLDVRSVKGGPAGVVWVGYQGLPNCEAEFYKDVGQLEDPNVFKSGDVDRVELQPGGALKVVHYDLSSVAHTVPGYGAREKICSVYRIVWDKARGSVWFGSNHGFTWAEAAYQGGTGCTDTTVLAANEWLHVPTDGGVSEMRQRCTRGVMEHVHPSIFSPPTDGSANPSLIAGNAMGIAVRPDTGDVWVGTAIRTTLFRIMTNGAARAGFVKDAFVADGAPWDFEAARKLSADKSKYKNRVDVWPDLDTEPQKTLADPEPNGLFTQAERRDDEVTGLVVMSDKTAWVSSWRWGLAQLTETPNGIVVGRRLFEGSSDANIQALGRDTHDESLWVGHGGGGGLSRIQADKLVRFDAVIGGLGGNPVWDIQFVGTGPSRKVLVGFRAKDGRPGGVGVFSGQ